VPEARLQGPQLELLLKRLDDWRHQLNRRSDTYLAWGNSYRRLHLWLGLPTAALSAVAGISALAEYETLAFVIALLVTLLTALTTFLKPNDTFHKHFDDSRRCAKLAADSGALALRLRAYGDDGTAWETYEELRRRAGKFIDEMDAVPLRYGRRYDRKEAKEEAKEPRAQAKLEAQDLSHGIGP
jgi:hypothetical protein